MNFSVVALPISPFISLAGRKSRSRSLRKRLFLQHGVLMAKLSHLVQSMAQFLSELVVWMKRIKSLLELPSGVCNGHPFLGRTSNLFYLQDAGIKHSISLTQTGKREIDLAKGISPAIPSPSTSIHQASIS